MDKIKEIQHNVAYWKTHKHNLTNTYLSIDPNIILINSRGLRKGPTTKTFGYTTYKVNTNNKLQDGSAILN